jgi:hypothetical protein
VVVSLGLALGSLVGVAPVSASTTQVINNSAIRFGNGTQASIGSTGLLRQPFYYSGSSWRQLTFSSYPLDLTFGYGTGNGSQWNGNTVYSLSEDGTQPVSAATVDYSGLTLTSGLTPPGGWGVVTSRADFSLGGAAVRFEHKYSLGQNDDFVRIETKVTNNSANPLPASSIWVGTRDDYVGGSDVPNKKRGNISQSGFTAIANAASSSNAIQISTAQEGVLFYSVSDNASSVVNGCCSFSNVVTQNPATSTVDVTSDGSYAMYFPLGNLAAGASATVVWFYAAGSIQDLSAVVQQVAAAGAAEQTLNVVTTDGGTLNYNFNYSGTAYYLVVDRGATAPTGAEIVAGANYGSVTKRASGNAVMTGSGSSWSTSFNITGLSQATQYTVYTATRYTDPNDNTQTLTSSVETVNFSTRPTAPTGITITPSSQQLSVAFTAPANITNIQYSTDGGSTWVTRNPVSVASPLVIGSLTNGTSYSVQLRGVFDSQSGTASSTVTATAGAVPGVPQNVSIVYGSTSGATVTWDAPASNGGNAITSYTVEYKKDGNWLPLTPNVRTVEITDVWVNTSWQFRVAATNVIGTGSFVTITNTPAPPAVTGGGTTTLVTQTNQSSITATPGTSVVGTVNNGVVTPVAATVTRVTSTTAADIQTDIANIVTNFNQRWDGTGTNPAPPVSKVATNDGALIFGLVSTATNSTPIGVPADDVILITTNDQAVLLAAANGDQPASVNSSGALVVNDGSVLGFAVNGFAPNTQGELVIMSNPTMLGTFTTDANGSFSGQAVIPAGFPVGNHTAVLITANLVTSMGLVVEGRPSAGGVPYLGPMMTQFSTRNLPADAAATVLVDGVRLSIIESIRINNLPVPFLFRQTGDLVLSLPALPAGTYDLVITYLGGARLTHQSVFFVSEAFSRPVPVSSLRITSFAGNSFALTASARRSIELTLNGYKSIEKVICVGSTSGTRVTAADRRLATQRAQAACNYVKQLQPSVAVEIRSNPAAGVGPRFRNVTIQVIEN